MELIGLHTWTVGAGTQFLFSSNLLFSSESFFQFELKKVVHMDKLYPLHMHGFSGRENVKKYHANGAPLFARI